MTRARIPIALASAAAVCGLLTACGSGGTASTFDPQITTEVSAAKNPVASVDWNLPLGEPTSLDPAQSALISNSTVVANLCESLLTQTPSGALAPGLATSIDRIDDLTYVITLRSGVQFWNGHPMTAEDVAFSINRILDPVLASPWSAWAETGGSAAVTRENEVTVSVSQPSALLENTFSTPAFAVVEKAFAEQKGEAFGTAEGGVMCTGPYAFGKWSSGSDLTIIKNNNWWNKELTPLVNEATFSFTSDASALTAGLRSGSFDGSFSVPASGFSSLNTEGTLLFNHSYRNNWLSLNPARGLTDLKARQALRALINYDGIVESVYQGTAEPLRALVPPATWGYSEEIYKSAYEALPEAKQDLTTAKKLLDESSYNGSEVVLAYPSTVEDQVKMATVIADDAKSIGMNISLKPMQLSDYLNLFGTDPSARDGIDAFFVLGYLDYPEPTQGYQYLMSTSYYNYAGYSNPKYDEAISSALQEFDDAKRAEDVTTGQAILAEDLVALPILTDYMNVYYSNNLTGLAPSPSYLYSPWLATLGGK